MTIIAEGGAIWKGGFYTRPPTIVPGPQNLPPVTGPDDATVEAGATVVLDVLANDFDPEGGELSLLTASANQGIVVINPDATLTYTAPEDFSGTATITYSVSDPEDRASTGSAQILVTAPTVPLPIVSVSDAPAVVSASSALLQFTSSESGTYLVSGSTISVSGTADAATNSVLLTGLADDVVYTDVRVTVTNSAGTSAPAAVPSFTLIDLDIEIGGLGEVNFITRFDDQTLTLEIVGEGALYDGTYVIDPNDFLALRTGPINLVPPSISQSGDTLTLVPALNLQREDGGAISEEIEWLADGVPIADETMNTLNAVPYAGQTVSLRITATDLNGMRVFASSDSIAIPAVGAFEGSADVVGITITSASTVSAPVGSADVAGVTIIG